MGAFGVVVGALALFLIKEPERGRFQRYEDQCARDEGRTVQQTEEDAEASEPDQNIVQSFVTALKDCVKNPVTRWATIATMFRFVSMFACDYYIPAYFLGTYPQYRAQFSYVFAGIVAFCGLSSSILGGVLSDKFKTKSHKAYSWISIGGAAIAWPFQLLACLCTNNFWLAMCGTAGKYLFGENFWGPNIAMISNSCPRNKLGNYVSAQ